MPSSDSSANLPERRIVACPNCGGDGFTVDQSGHDIPCVTCAGIGFYQLSGSRILYWDKTLSRRQLDGERFARRFRQLINGTLVVIGAVGFAFGFWNLYLLLRDEKLFTEFWQLRNNGMAVFWLSLVTDCYAYYRIDRERHPRQMITPPTGGPAIPSVGFEELRTHAELHENVAEVLTPELEGTLQIAWAMADRLNHRHIWPSHILAALLTSSSTALVFARLGIDPQKLRGKIGHLFSGLPQDWSGEPRIDRSTRELFFTAYLETVAARRQQVGVLEVLIALATSEAATQAVLYDLEVDETRLRHVVAWIRITETLRNQYRRYRSRSAWRPKHGMNRAMTAQETRLVNQYCHDLTEMAQIGALPLTVDRDQELSEIFRVLERGGSPLLVGNPGVGKSAIVNGLAQRMAADDVPTLLKDKRLVSLSVTSLISGVRSMGDVEGRLSRILSEIVRSGNVVLFIDNVQNMVGVSSSGGENFDLSDVLAQAMGHGAIQVVATTTPIDFRRSVEQKSGIVSAFTRVDCEEVDNDGAILILESKAGGIEYHQNVFFTYDAIEKTVSLAQRYIHDRYLPEKAITLLEEVAVDVRKRRGKNAFVVGEDAARVVSEKTHIQVTKVTANESERLLNLESIMHQRMVGQDEAVQAVASALRRARAELRDTKRPISNFLFLGPTGVGKTELAKTVAEAYFGSEDNMIRIDMSEYQDQSSIYRLIGAPPGYAGASSGGYLTEAIRSKPFSLVLLDEIEKAHKDILNVFLQVMDDGRLTDGTGRTVDFTNAIIIATSNAGTSLIQERLQAGMALEEIREELISTKLAEYFRPEFLNRFDRIILFRPLTMEEIVEIVRLLLGKVAHQLKDRGISFVASDEAIRELAQIGYDPVFGARPLRRVIQERVDNALANFLLQGQLTRRDVAVLEPGGTIRVEKAEQL